MALFLVHPAVDLTLELYVPQRLEEALAVQWERIRDRDVRKTFVRRLEGQLEGLLKESLDWDLKEPTASQLAYATVIAAKLGISVPSEARKFRFHMALFLDTHSKVLKGQDQDGSRESPVNKEVRIPDELTSDSG